MFKKIFHTLKNSTLIEENNLKNYFSSTSWFIVEKIFRVGIGFIIGVYVARFLGPEKFGIFNYAISFVTLFSAFTTLGLDSVLIKELVHEPQKKDALLSTAFWLKTIGAIIALLLIAVLLLWLPHEASSEKLIFIIACTFLFQAFSVIDLFFQSKILSKRIILAQLTQVVISAIFKLLLVSFNAPLIWFGFAMILDSVILSIGLSVVYLKHNPFRINILKFDREIAKQLFKNSLPLFLSEITIAIYMRIDQVIIKTFLGNEAVGYYAAAIIICEAAYFIPFAIIRTFFPVILSNKKADTELYYKNIQKLYDMVVITSFSLALLISFTADKIVLLLFGNEFLETILIVKIYTWTSVFIFLGAANERWLLAENYQKYMLYRTFWGCILSVGLNLILVPWLNIKGGAISALISFCFVSYLTIFIFKPLRKHFIIVSRSLNIISGFKRIFNI